MRTYDYNLLRPFKKYSFIWKIKRVSTHIQGDSDTERLTIIHWFTCPNSHNSQVWAAVARSQKLHQSLQKGGKGLSTWTTFCCLSRAIHYQQVESQRGSQYGMLTSLSGNLTCHNLTTTSPQHSQSPKVIS